MQITEILKTKGVEGVRQVVNNAAPYPPPDQKPAQEPKPLPIKWASSIPIQSVEWIFKGWLPLGNLSLFTGEGGVGKSTITCDILARLSNGKPFPFSEDDNPPEPSPSLIISAEDGASDTIVPRLLAAGADLSKVAIFDMEKAFPVFPASISILEAIIEETQARVIVIDPIMSFLQSGIKSGSDNEVRLALTPLANLAKKHRIAMLLIHHYNKNESTRAVFRAGGSVAFSNAARSVFTLVQDDEDDDHAMLCWVKGNLLDGPSPLSIKLNARNIVTLRPPDVPKERDVATVAWISQDDRSADEILAAADPKKGGAKVKEAEDFLKDHLSGGPDRAQSIYFEASRCDIRERTLRRAMRNLRLISKQHIDGQAEAWWYTRAQWKDHLAAIAEAEENGKGPI